MFLYRCYRLNYFVIIYFFLDKEKSKECYSIASEIEQAKILHKAFTTMIRQDDELVNMVHITKQPPKVTKMDGAFIDEYTALSSTADSKDGLNVSLLLIDEPHTFTSKDLYDFLSNGQAGRREPLEIFMSTAGFDLQNFFYLDIYQYAKKIQSGIVKDDSFYYILFEPTEEDLKNPDWFAEFFLCPQKQEHLIIQLTDDENKVIDVRLNKDKLFELIGGLLRIQSKIKSSENE